MTIFFPTLAAEGITTIIDMGDTFDNRRNIDFWSLKWAKENYYDRLRDMGITVYTVVGNHTAYYKNNNSINTIDLLLREYDNIIPIVNSAEHTIGGTKFLFLSWMNKENEDSMIKKIKKSDAKVAVGHLELNGFAAYVDSCKIVDMMQIFYASLIVSSVVIITLAVMTERFSTWEIHMRCIGMM